MAWQWPPGWRKIRAEVFRTKGRRCWHCGAPAVSVDHYPVPAAMGGPAELWNLVPSCQPCNSGTGASMGNRLRPPRPLTAAQRRAIAAKRAGVSMPARVPRSARRW
jgi:5-methylcytosine-specific restriction endonuclease McrA